MKIEKICDINSAFNIYKNLIFAIENDLRFWQSFLELSIKTYKNQELIPKEIFSSMFTVYDFDIKSNEGYIKSLENSYSIKTSDLDFYSDLFFIWVMNLSILKSYNAMETLFHQAIWLKYYPTLKNPSLSKKNTDILEKEIKAYLNAKMLKSDTKNNRHLIEFLKSKSTEFELFCQMNIRIDLKTNWSNFFELNSILRNIIAHKGTHITSHASNQIKSIAKDVFERHFLISVDENLDKQLNPIKGIFTNFLDFTNEFSLNTTKFIFDQKDLSFLGLK
jgi:hypothetical protein